jgi:serine/threonine protein kinase
LSNVVNSRASNAAVFVDSLWTGIEYAKANGLKVPSPRVINKILEKHAVPLKLDPPHLSLADGDAVIVEGTTKSGSASSNPSPLFVLGEQIGSGGYGVVYKATRTTAVGEFEYALKVLDPSPFVSDYGKAIRRFQREVKAMQSLQHRAIVPYYEAGLTADNKPYIVMPYIQGDDLRAAASSTDVHGVLAMFLEIAAALEYAHGKNVLHRDLKPTNVIVRQLDQQPIILDLGSSYLLDYIDSHSLTSQVVGTIGYIPSEVLNNPKDRSPSQDVYACGVMLYECLAGHMPDLADYEPLEEIDSAYKPLDLVVRKATARASKRTQSAEELHKQLSSIRNGFEE